MQSLFYFTSCLDLLIYYKCRVLLSIVSIVYNISFGCLFRVTQLLEHEYAAQGILHSSIRSRRSRRDSHDNILRHVLKEGFSNNFAIHISVRNGIVSTNALGTVNVEGTNTGLDGDLQQVSGIRGVPSSNYQNEVQTKFVNILHQVVNSILSFLSGITDGIKLHVVTLGIHRSVFLHHCLLQQLSNSTSLLLVHGGLVRKTELREHGFWVKPGADSLSKVCHECFRISTIHNVVRQHLGFLHVLDADVIFTKRHSGDGFLVSVLSVNDTGESLLLVGVNGIPDLGNPWAGGIDNFHVLLVEQFHLFKGSSKGWKNDDITIING
mmetsp:Transcript_2538/g.4072  ORF Transcript_2538/g.4072 Transcript_2538/m.4072 type:complete len:323 (+) Transcript_2538:14-982(+)